MFIHQQTPQEDEIDRQVDRATDKALHDFGPVVRDTVIATIVCLVILLIFGH
jgi:hypothetical protein